MTQPPNSQPPLGDQISEAIRQVLKPGGVIVGSGVAFWQLLSDGGVGKAIASFLIGAGTSYGARMLKPLHEEGLKAADTVGEAMGDAFGEVTQRAITKASGFEKRYLLCQASDCESVRAEGMAQREGIFEPLLKDVFVELRVDSEALPAGLGVRVNRRLEEALLRNQTIWDFLAESQKNRQYRHLAILAWGGYGKTTLLKHVAYRYGLGQVPKGAPKLVPILIVLRKYREQLCEASPLNLPEFVNEYHIPSLPEAHLLQPIQSNWAKDLLQKGRALVMFDGFDEVPKAERPKVARWINEQMRQYGKSVFVVTSRPKAYKEQVSADRLVLSMPMWVQPFNDAQRRSFVESWYLCQEKLKARRDSPEVRKVAGAGAQDLLQQIEAEAELKDLAKNPLLLNMIATFHRLYPGAALPKRRVDLYGEICALQLKNRPRDRRLDTVLLEFDPQPVLEEIAFGMMQQTLKRIDEDALLTAMQKALAAQDEAVKAVDLLGDVVRISELMVQQEEEYEFAHLSFQEYLAAAYLAGNPGKREQWLYNQFENDWWKATILLYAGKTKKPSRLIREAIRQDNYDLAYACWQQTNKRVDKFLQTKLELANAWSNSIEIGRVRYEWLESCLKNGDWE
ncbi:MAG: NACHT domain-containing protein, partial [Cyanobacteria bacterium J06554_3]